MSNYLDFTSSVSWATLRVYYEETYDSATNTTTLTVTSIQAKSTNYTTTYYPDGVLKINGEPVITVNSAVGDWSVDIDSKDTWYPIEINSEPVTGSIQIVHDHEGSDTATIELTSNRISYGFIFYSSSGEDGNGWYVNDSQTVTLTVENPDPVVVPTETYGTREYLFGNTTFPRLPKWDRTAYPHFVILHNTIDSYTVFYLIAMNNIGAVENGVLNVDAESLKYLSWVIAADETGDNILQDTYSRVEGYEWYTYDGDLPVLTNIIWTSTTLNNGDGSTFLESSKGIWLINIKKWTTGYAMGSVPANLVNHTDRLLGWLVSKRLSAQRTRENSADVIDTSGGLYGYFNPNTAEAKFGIGGVNDIPSFQIGHSGMSVVYSNGHLIMEDEQ